MSFWWDRSWSTRSIRTHLHTTHVRNRNCNLHRLPHRCSCCVNMHAFNWIWVLEFTRPSSLVCCRLRDCRSVRFPWRSTSGVTLLRVSLVPCVLMRIFNDSWTAYMLGMLPSRPAAGCVVVGQGVQARFHALWHGYLIFTHSCPH